jgi:hypothetical protein
MPRPTDPVTQRVRDTADGLAALLADAAAARAERFEGGSADAGAGSGADAGAASGSGAVCAWNHFENIPTFYNWNNRPR